MIFSLALAGCQPVHYDRSEAQVEQLDIAAHFSDHYYDLSPSPVTGPIAVPADTPEGWIPPVTEQPGRWQGIVIHHSAIPDWGSAADLDRAHRGRGFDGLGYDFVIGNGRGSGNGQIEVGWRWLQQREGAHCRISQTDDNYWNEHTIGIVLVGDFDRTPPSAAQYAALAKLVKFLQQRYHIPDAKLMGHSDVKGTHCPGRYFSLPDLRRMLHQE